MKKKENKTPDAALAVEETKDITPETKAENESTPDLKPEVKEEKAAEVKPETKEDKTADTENTKDTEEKVPETNETDDQNAKFAMTVKQIWNLIKGFCSKDAVNTIASQCNEKLPIWGILLPAYALLSAISATVSFNANGTFKNDITSIAGAKTDFGSGEVFFIMFALEITLAFAMSLAVRSFIKFHKGDGHFLSSANLVTASYLPVMFVLAFNIVTVGAISPLLDTVKNLASIASTMLLFAGVSKALGGKKPIWSFFLMIIIASLVAVAVAMIFISPILFSRFAYSLIETINKN